MIKEGYSDKRGLKEKRATMKEKMILHWTEGCCDREGRDNRGL